MKQIIIASLSVLFIISCGNKKVEPKAEDKQQVEVPTESSKTYTIDTRSTVLGWKCSKSTGTHHGTIQVTKGSISVEKEKITAGRFTIDMKTIKDDDLTDPKENKKLVSDLSSDNLFDVEKYPVSTFEITSSEKMDKPDGSGNNYSIKGNLTIKDVTKNITIPAKITITAQEFSATSNFSIQRTDFKLKYGKGKLFKGIGDSIINNTIEYTLKLKATVS
jgi:polyisoprenoid-binding protein YceI